MSKICDLFLSLDVFSLSKPYQILPWLKDYSLRLSANVGFEFRI